MKRRATSLASLCALALAACAGTHAGPDATPRGEAPLVAAVTPRSAVHARPFPRLSAGEPCPRTRGGHATNSATIITLGAGPVYPIMGFSVAPPAAAGVIDYQAEGKPHRDGLWGDKVLFAVPKPGRAGAFTVEGRKIDGSGRIDWLIENGQLVGKLELPGGGNWYPTEALLKGPGCYALRIDGASFSHIIVFEAVSKRTFRALSAGHASP